MKPVVGLTGGIASGKSSVAGYFRELGIPVIDADELARKVVEPGTPGLAALVQEFGPAIVNADCTLHREKLGQLVFTDARARQRVNEITHPLIAAAGQQEIERLQTTDAPFIIYEAALLVENRAHLAFDTLIVVDTGEEKQIERIALRNQLTRDEAIARIRSQATREERRKVATFVIENHGDLDDLRQKTADVYRSLLARHPRVGGDPD